MPGMIAVPTGWLSIAVIIATLAPLAQEPKYRERQVLDPEEGEWVDQPVVPETGAPAGELDEARRLIAEGQPGKARPLLKKWIKENPDSERIDEAEFLVGETYFESKDYWRAVEKYQLVADSTSGELFNLAQGRCIDVARAFLAGEKRIVLYVLRLPAYDDGVEILDRVWQRAPGSRLGELALRLRSDFFFERGEMQIAQDEYANLARQYPSGRYVQLAMVRSAEAAEASFPGVPYDDQSLIDADERYRQLHDTFPALAARENAAARRDGIREKRAEKDLYVAQWYEKTRQLDAAKFYYRRILTDWPGTLGEAQARARLRAMGVESGLPGEDRGETQERGS